MKVKKRRFLSTLHTNVSASEYKIDVITGSNMKHAAVNK